MKKHQLVVLFPGFSNDLSKSNAYVKPLESLIENGLVEPVLRKLLAQILKPEFEGHFLIE